jgi:thermitase
MKRAMISLLAVVLLLAFALPAELVAEGPGSSELQILVRFEPGTTLPQTATIHRQAGGRVKDTIPAIGVQVVTLPARTAAARLRNYATHPLVRYVEPDYIAEVVGTPNDPGFGNQWGLHKVEAATAWDTTTGSAGVSIAILDTGVDQNHPDLKDKIVKNVNFTGSSTVNDVHGHGTHVAGIAAASTNNGIGVAGLGYASTIMNVKVLGDDGSGSYSWVTNGIIWAADNGARVINMSLGGSSSSRALEDAINYAWSKGAVVVAAAGNSGSSSPFYPAYYTNCMAVAATDSYDRKPSWSNYGSWVDVAAPGVDIYSTLRGNNYGYKSGTSMASPFVAGLAALVFTTVSDDNGNGRLNDEVRATIESTCDDIRVSGIGAGRINAARAVQSGQKVLQPDIDLLLTTDRTSVSQVDDVITYTYTVTNTAEVDLTGIVVTDSRLGNVTLGATSLTTAASTSGTTTYTVTQADIDSGADLVNTATVTCAQGVTDTDSATVMVEVPAVPAVYVSPSNQTGSGWPGENVTYEFTVQNTGTVSDTYAVSVASTWSSSVSPQSLTLAPGAAAPVTVTHSVPGDASIGDSNSGTVQVLSAGTGASASATFATAVEEKQQPSAPVIDRFDITNNSNRISARATVTWAVSDVDGDLATVRVLLLANGNTVDSVSYVVSGSQASGSCQLSHRTRRGTTYTISLIVTDALGNTTSQTKPLSS